MFSYPGFGVPLCFCKGPASCGACLGRAPEDVVSLVLLHHLRSLAVHPLGVETDKRLSRLVGHVGTPASNAEVPPG